MLCCRGPWNTSAASARRATAAGSTGSTPPSPRATWRRSGWSRACPRRTAPPPPPPGKKPRPKPRPRPLAGYALCVHALLFLTYFAHAVPHAVALVAIGALWLAGLPRRRFARHLLHVALLAPQAVLPLWFASGAGAPLPRRMGLGRLADYLVTLRVLVAFGPRQERIAAAVAIAFLAILAVGVAAALARGRWRPWPPREEDGFLL